MTEFLQFSISVTFSTTSTAPTPNLISGPFALVPSKGSQIESITLMAACRYMTQMCRINGEPHTTFPFMCSLSDLMRAKKTLHGIKIKLGAEQQLDVHVREWPFLSRQQVPDAIKVRPA